MKDLIDETNKYNPIMSNASKYKGWYSKGIPAMVCKTYKEIWLK